VKSLNTLLLNFLKFGNGFGFQRFLRVLEIFDESTIVSVHTRKAERLQLSAHTNKTLKEKGQADGMTFGNQKILHRALGNDPLQMDGYRKGGLPCFSVQRQAGYMRCGETWRFAYRNKKCGQVRIHQGKRSAKDTVVERKSGRKEKWQKGRGCRTPRCIQDAPAQSWGASRCKRV